MISQPRYQVFLSSTYEDLREERQQATQAILEAGFFPSGMELFPASDLSQWQLIRRVIEESDYYIVIVGGRYGSQGPTGLSYTEMEYDYAVEKGVPVLGFVHSDLENIPSKFCESDDQKRRKLDAFRQKVQSRTCRMFKTAHELGMAVLKSIVSEARVTPRMGWVRADLARTEQDEQRERKLRELLDELADHNEKLVRELRDRAILHTEIPRERLAQGDDLFEFSITFKDNQKNEVLERVSLTWNDIFRAVGVNLFGFIQRKSRSYDGKFTYDFQGALEDKIRLKVFDRVQNRKINLSSTQVDECIIQFKELGFVMFDEKVEKNGEVFRGVTLTEQGERELSLLSTRRKEAA
jgi:hypothetical protein